jgi:hypothetical protein
VRALARARLLAFSAAAATALAAAARPGDPRPLLTVTAALAALFAVLVRRHGRARAEHERARDLAALNRDGRRRVLRDWDSLAGPAWAAAPAGHLYAADLDLFGDTGLVRLLPPLSAAAGRATLRAWLLDPAPPATARERHAAVAELARARALRDELALRAGRVWLGAAQVERLVAWGEGPGWLSARPATLWAARLLPLATVALVALQVGGVVAAPFWWGTLLAAAALTAAHRRALAATVAGVLPEPTRSRSTRASSRRRWGRRWPRRRSRASRPRCAWMGRPLTRTWPACGGSRTRPRRGARRCSTWPCSSSRSGTFTWCGRSSGGRRARGPRLRGWLLALGELEALAALGTLAHDNPGWCFPELDDAAGGALSARALAHPLLPPATAVANDVTVGPPGRFLLVTGSNMAGKSTLIRAVGLNAVLAQCGGPVCAAWMRCPPLGIATSIRVHDSLERGVSYFMAELERLKVITDAARAAGPGAAALPARRDAAGHQLRRPHRGGAPGDRPPAPRGRDGRGDHARPRARRARRGGRSETARRVADAATVVHFAEQVHQHDGRAVMTFDFRMREGVATSTNALALLRLVGLGD